jgi:hypothetical protein
VVEWPLFELVKGVVEIEADRMREAAARWASRRVKVAGPAAEPGEEERDVGDGGSRPMAA